MKKAAILLLLFSGISAILPAQVPGYQGYRLMLGYKNFVTMPISHPNARGHFAFDQLLFHNYDPEFYSTDSMLKPYVSKKWFSWQFTHALSLTYVLSRSHEIQADLRFYKAGLLLVDDGFGPWTENYNTGVQYLKGTVETFTGVGMDVLYKKYFYPLAPFNFYQAYGLGIEFLTGTSPERKYDTPSPQTSIKTSLFRMLYQFGKNTVIGDRLLLDYGFSFNPAAVLEFGDSGGSSHGYVSWDRKRMKTRAGAREGGSFYMGMRYMLK